jgi:hypothetical protein
MTASTANDPVEPDQQDKGDPGDSEEGGEIENAMHNRNELAAPAEITDTPFGNSAETGVANSLTRQALAQSGGSGPKKDGEPLRRGGRRTIRLETSHDNHMKLPVPFS